MSEDEPHYIQVFGEGESLRMPADAESLSWTVMTERIPIEIFTPHLAEAFISQSEQDNIAYEPVQLADFLNGLVSRYKTNRRKINGRKLVVVARQFGLRYDIRKGQFTVPPPTP